MYESRLATLRQHGIGLRDVVADARRKGSLDSQIRNRNDNDLLGLLECFPNVKAIAFNGGTAGRLGLKVLIPRAGAYQVLTLPSSSPAYTLSYADKAAQLPALRALLQLPELGALEVVEMDVAPTALLIAAAMHN